MYCSKCGTALKDNQAFCPKCGDDAGKSLLKGAVDAAEQTRFDHNVHRLSHYWIIFAALTLVLGLAGYFMGPAGTGAYTAPYEPWPHPPVWNWTFVPSVVWILLASRVVLSLLAAWGLKERFNWSRPVAILAGAVAITQFPIGLILGAYTIALLVGKHRAAMFAHQG